MSEQEDALADLEGHGALAGIRWAGASAYRRLMADYDADTGHNQGWIGYTAHVLLSDRLDRVFSCGDYAAPIGRPASAGLDVVAAGLSRLDRETMPLIVPGTVVYSPLNNSPGWRCGEWRWLLASFPHGESNKIPWTRKSATKQRVASHPDPDQPGLFDNNLLFPFNVLADALEANEAEENIATLVLAHSIHKDLLQREFLLGRSSILPKQAWHWKQNLMGTPPEPGGHKLTGTSPTPNTPDPNTVPDAPVRLRKKPQENNRDETSG